jgi:hypothetical protein
VYIITHLAVARHNDGRHLVYIERRAGGGTQVTGELAAELGDLEPIAARLCGQNNVPNQLVADCLSFLRQRCES